jgi:omega-6 fatty acid desaturase (delta-12 desaturase)
MTLDYTSHPAEIVGSGEVKGVKKMVTIDDLKRAIPAYCFKPTYTKSLFFLVRDLLVISAFGTLAWSYIPQIQSTPARYVAWIVYGYMQGLAFTGFWVSCVFLISRSDEV